MNDQQYMQLAINLAQVTKGQTAPNPVVGAVVVNDGKLVGMGAHLKAGEVHAEVHALQMAKEEARGATIYVTLEPCSHHGKTPPCADLIIEKQVRRVVVASVDPNPQVSGRGIRKLKEAGIEVDVGVLKEEADQLNKMFFHAITSHTPYVTLKSAVSLDGKIATIAGESKWITGEAARIDSHRYRHEHDAILVGVGTVLADNPTLTTRLPNGGKNPIRVILDHQLRTPLEAKIVVDHEAPTWIIVSSQANPAKISACEALGVTVIQLETERLEIEEVVQLLAMRGLTSIFVEGGAEVNGSFLQAGIVHQVITYMAPKLIGGRRAPTSFAGEGIARMADVMELEMVSVEKVGDDIKVVSVPKERV